MIADGEELERIRGDLEKLHERCDRGFVRQSEISTLVKSLDARVLGALPEDSDHLRLYESRVLGRSDWWEQTLNGYVARSDCPNIERRLAAVREILEALGLSRTEGSSVTMSGTALGVVEFRPGVELANRYIIHSCIGAGGFASVWKAVDKQLGRDVAIKRFLRRSAAVSDFEAEAVEEGRKTAQLIHPNIVQIHDIFKLDNTGEHLIVMEFVDGPSLHHLFREKALRSERYALDETASLLRGILAGVAHAHSKNICHRDITPLNILVSSSGTPKIADFGIARILRDAQPPGDAGTAQGGTGNPSFMAPEQARGEGADFLSDLFMVGIIGYLLITGRHPFAHQSGLFEIRELLRDESFSPEPPRPPLTLDASQQRIYREYAAVVMRLLKRERAARFTSAREAIEAIEAVHPFIECPDCGERVSEDHSFCHSCGARLAQPEPALQSSVDESAETAESLVDQGFQLTRGQRWGDAVEKYKKAIDLEPTYQHAYWSLGFALNRLDRFEEAIGVLRRGIALRPTKREHEGQFHYALAFAYANLKQYELALKEVREALVLQPGSQRALYLRARIHAEIADVKAALSDAKAVLSLNPDHLGALRLLQSLEGLSRTKTPEESLRVDPGGKASLVQALVGGARQEMSRRGFNSHMEIEYWPSNRGLRWDQNNLLSAARDAQVPGSGWPIGLVFEPPDVRAPKPRNYGVQAEIIGENTNAYNVWAIDVTGHFCQLESLIEAIPGAKEIQFDTRIRRVAEALTHAKRLYTSLRVANDEEVCVRIGHHGLIEMPLGTADPERYHSLSRRSSEDRVVREIDVRLVDLAGDSLASQVEQLLAPLFTVFQFTRVDSAIYNEIVARFRASHPGA